jgi:hypothetical protein
MVPADYANFFAVMAGVGATLFGLIFLVISIRPEVTSTESSSIMRQVQVASSYTALLNPLVISLRALVPHATIGLVTLIMSAIGLVNTIVMGVSLLQNAMLWRKLAIRKSAGNSALMWLPVLRFHVIIRIAKKLNSIFFILGSTVIFGLEIFYAIRLDVVPGDLAALDSLTTLLVVIYLYGIARAWHLVGARHFHIQELFAPLIPKRMQEIVSDTLHAESTKDAKKQGD